jgi:hypothetical protein
MNERIKELAEQAKAYSDQQWLEAGYPNWEIYSIYYTKDYNEKFAELIVRECAKIADDGCGSACFGLGINGAMLLQHFGVEE